jgi:hypothetical protein
MKTAINFNDLNNKLASYATTGQLQDTMEQIAAISAGITKEQADALYAKLSAFNDHVDWDLKMYEEWSDYLTSRLDGLNTKQVILNEKSLLNLVTLGTTWTAPMAGKVTIIYRAALGVAPSATQNGEQKFGGVSILGTGVPKDFPTTTGDIWEFSGSLLGLGSSIEVIFYSV